MDRRQGTLAQHGLRLLALHSFAALLILVPLAGANAACCLIDGRVKCGIDDPPDGGGKLSCIILGERVTVDTGDGPVAGGGTLQTIEGGLDLYVVPDDALGREGAMTSLLEGQSLGDTAPDLERFRESLEVLNGQIEADRVRIETLRQSGAIDGGQYRELFSNYKAAIQNYHDGLHLYRDGVSGLEAVER